MPECSLGASTRATRLRTPAQFAAAAGERATWRATRQWLAASARVELEAPGLEGAAGAPKSGDGVNSSASALHSKPEVPHVRFGFTVGRRQARRAVQRAMVKRVLREAAHGATTHLCPLVRERAVDVVLRLRSPLPDRSQMGLSQLKRSLRAQADSLIAQLARHLRGGPR
jgi:ribonuclease P protein component